MNSLGEACLKAGGKEGAARNYAKSLELDPGNNTAREVLKTLARAVIPQQQSGGKI